MKKVCLSVLGAIVGLAFTSCSNHPDMEDEKSLFKRIGSNWMMIHNSAKCQNAIFVFACPYLPYYINIIYIIIYIILKDI